MRQRWRLRGRAATFDYFPSKFYCIQATCNYLNIRNKKDGAIASRKSSRREEREREAFSGKYVTSQDGARKLRLILKSSPFGQQHALSVLRVVCGTSSMNSCRHQTGSITRLPFLFLGRRKESTPFRSRFVASGPGLGTRLLCLPFKC